MSAEENRTTVSVTRWRAIWHKVASRVGRPAEHHRRKQGRAAFSRPKIESMDRAMTSAEQGTLRYRQINALSWRVASELSRRDAGLYIGLTGGDGSAAQANALMMTSPTGQKYQARRCGLGFTAGSGPSFELPWDRALGAKSARAIAVMLEESLGVHRPRQSPPTSPRALGYRVVASILEMTLGDRRYWSTEEAMGGPLDAGSSLTPERLQPWEDTQWFVVREGETVARVDNFGWVEVSDRKIDLHSRYRELNSRLFPLVMEIFGDVLP